MKDYANIGLEILLSKRYHGAVSINGFYYQILFSVNLGCSLFSNREDVLTLEGIEDIDLLKNIKDKVGSECKNSSSYIQVKYRKSELNWTDFSEIVVGFAKIYVVDKTRDFKVITNKKFATSVKDFLKKKKLKKKIVDDTTISLSNQEIDELLSKINLEIHSKHELEQQNVEMIISECNCLEETAKYIHDVLLAQFYNVSINRGNITYDIISNICTNTQETIASEEYNAYGEGLISRVDWSNTSKEDDFYNGKYTLPSHIKDKCGIKRSNWINYIFNKFNDINDKSDVVFLRASSGQGKTTLMYQYALEFYNENQIYIINNVESENEAVSVVRYLNSICKLGLPILILIDDVKASFRYKSKIISQCQDKDINFLITIRQENWNHIPISNFEFKVVDVYLDDSEAESVFKKLNDKGLVCKSFKSYLQPFELLDKPRLLIEYVYLSTKGILLKDRLNDQIRELSYGNYSVTKKNIIRLVSLAHMLDIYIPIDEIVKLIPLYEDTQIILNTLNNEYIMENGDYFTGLHQTRSKHLVEILHDKYIPVINTLNQILPYCSLSNIYSTVYNILTNYDIEYNNFIDKSKSFFSTLDLASVINVLKAFYSASVCKYVANNITLINKAYSLTGFGSLMIISYELSLIGKNLGFVSALNESVKGFYPKLRDIVSRFSKDLNSYEYILYFLQSIDIKTHLKNIKDIGIFLYWINLVKFECNLSNELSIIIKEIEIDKVDFSELCYFTFGLFNYNYDLYLKFIKQNQKNLQDSVKYNLSCHNIIENKDSIIIEFCPILAGDTEYLNIASKKLEKLYMIYPGYNRYDSRPKEINIGGLVPNASKNTKHTPPKNLQPSFVTMIYSELYRQMIIPFLPKTSYDLQGYWNDFRRTSFNIMTELRLFYLNGVKPNDLDHLLPKMHKLYSQVIHIGGKTIDQISIIKSLSFNVKRMVSNDDLNNWATSISKFYTQFNTIILGTNKEHKLCLHNLYDSINHISKVHSFFNDYFKDNTDFFNISQINETELQYYQDVYDLLDYLWSTKSSIKVRNPIDCIKEMRVEKENNILQKIKETLPPSVELFNKIVVYGHIKNIVLFYAPSEPIMNFQDILNIVNDLQNNNTTDIYCYWFVPIYNNYRFSRSCFSLYSDSLTKILNNDTSIPWETFLPREVPTYIDNVISIYNLNESLELKPEQTKESIELREEFLSDLNEFVDSLPSDNKHDRLLKEQYKERVNKLAE